MQTVLRKSRQAITEVCRGADPQDEYFLVTFANRAFSEVDFTPNCGDIQERLLWMPAHGDTSLIDGTYLGFQQVRRARNMHKALILVSDGGENASRFSAAELKELAVETDAQLYAVGIGSFKPDGPVEEEEGPELMSDLARFTGGRYFEIGSPRDLQNCARQIAAELRNEYVIGYGISALKRSGRYHTVSIKIKRNLGQPRFSASWRRQYYYPKQ
jgi:Ca-activated chloride channel family protein